MSDLLALIRGGEPAPSTYVHHRSSKLPRPPRVPGQEQPVVEEPRKKGFFKSITSKVSHNKPSVPKPSESPPPNPPWIIAANASATSLPSTNHADGTSMRYMDGFQMERRGSMQLPGLDGGYSSSTRQLSRLASAHLDGSIEGLRAQSSSNDQSRRFGLSADNDYLNSRRPSVSSHSSLSNNHPNGARQEYAPPSSTISLPHSWDSSVLTIPAPALILPSASTSNSSSPSFGGHLDDPLREDSPPPAYSQRSSLTLGLGSIAKAKAKQPYLIPPNMTFPSQNTLGSNGEDAQQRDQDSSKSTSIKDVSTPARSPYPTAEQKAAAIAAVESRRKTHTGPLQPPIALAPLGSFLDL